MTADPTPKAPAGLTARSRKLWSLLVVEYDFGPSDLVLLLNALRVLDTADAAGEIVRREGVVVLDRYGTAKSNPAADAERSGRALFGRLIGQLNVSMPVGRPGGSVSKPGARARLPRDPRRRVDEVVERHRPYFGSSDLSGV